MEADARVIEVWAPWCPPCRTMGPIIERVADRTDQVILEKVNADEGPERVKELRVRTVPTLIAVRNSEEIARVTGTQSEEAIDALFRLAAGEQVNRLPGAPATDRIIRAVAAAILLVIGMLSGPAVPLIIAGAVIGVTALPRLGRHGREP